MKNTLLILSFLFPALAFGQFGLGNPNRTLTELGRQTTARGIVYYASGPPNTVITYRPNRDTAAYMWVDTLTSRRYEWNHTGNFWATQGIVSGASAPAATQTNGPALIDNRDAFFRSTVDNLFYFYDRTNLTWAEFGSGSTCGDCPVTTSDPISGDGTTGNPLTLKGYSGAAAGQYPVKNAGTGFAWNTVGLDTFAIVSNTLRASIYGDNVPFKSVSLAPYLDNTDAQNLTINGTSAPYVLAISGGADVEFDEGVGISLNESPANTLVITNTLPDVTVSLTGAGINAVTGTYPNFTITGTEVDGSTTNELQTLANTSDATSHTVTLSNSGGSVKLAEGSGITLTTTGTSGDGIVTIAATGGGSGVVSVTGPGVDNTDVHNPVVNARPYKVYTALLTQSGTSAPVATVLENTLGGTVTWNYEDVGDYSATLTGAFTTGKTWIIVGTDTATFSTYHTNPNSVGITSPAGNGALSSRSIEIRIYP